MKYVVIVAPGRSGSTLLQGVLNSIPGWCVRGENQNVTLPLYRAERLLLMAKRAAGGRTDSTHSFFGAEEFQAERFVGDLRRALLNQLIGDQPTPRAIGFKEIRWFEENLLSDNLWSYLQFLERLLPDVMFLALRRDTDDILKSAWWAHSDQDRSRLMIERSVRAP